MTSGKKIAKAIENGTDNEHRYDRDLIDILSEEVVGVIDPLIADKNLLRLVLADAYAKKCVRNHRGGTPSEDLAESIGIVEEMIVDCLCGSNPEYREIFDEGMTRMMSMAWTQRRIPTIPSDPVSTDISNI